MPIDKTYDPATVEAKLYERWEKSGAFACDVNSKAQPFCLMMPPPNVTGSLHMGHALNFTLQDILTRYARMKGRDALWQPGTDHAGIATQMMVEKQLAAEGKNMGRREMGREKFLERVWQWKKESGDAITKQLRRLGASCDWSRERFTMDPALNRAVVKAFVTLYRDGLIYKDKRLVNWDPKLQTAVSDLEVEQREVKGHLWHFKYPIENAKDEFIIIATTRPETMLGDVAVAVHPKNAKLKHLIGKFALLPLVGRRIPIVGDDYADPEKGTGAVKITPAHDFNDFEVGHRHKLPLINVFDAHARVAIQGNIPLQDGFENLDQESLNWISALDKIDRFEARKRVVVRLEELGFLDKIEPHTHTAPHGDRSSVVIEPWLSEQWYCNAKKLAEDAIEAVEKGKTKFVPEQWTNTYRAWMNNIEPWCISRQLWWGHQIPAWYGCKIHDTDPPIRETGGVHFVAETEAEAILEAQKYYDCEVRVLKSTPVGLDPVFDEMIKDQLEGKPHWEPIWRDEDVLDTWFSSALWPFSTLGWPYATPELKRYYPTDVLVTGFDIIFFWVARMMMMGIHLVKDVPFKTIYIHALVRDEKGQKMSKTKGNVIDPLDIIDKYGCDALRFTLANMSTPGRDIKLATGRIEGNRNFATKLWNAARYCQMNECAWDAKFNPEKIHHIVNKWILLSLRDAKETITNYLDEYRFDMASSTIYSFVWDNFCDWYLEFTKPILAGADEAAKTETKAMTAWLFEQMLRLLHPFMPYITEELWSQLISGSKLLMTQSWPSYEGMLKDFEAKEEIDWLIRLISTIRTTRAELNVPPVAKVQLQLKDASKETRARLERHQPLIMQLARLGGIDYVTSVPKGAAQAIVDETTLILPLADVIDLEQERARLGKESEKWVAEIKKIDSKLASKDFVDRAPPEIVEEQRERKRDAEAMLAKLQAAQRSLAG